MHNFYVMSRDHQHKNNLEDNFSKNYIKLKGPITYVKTKLNKMRCQKC